MTKMQAKMAFQAIYDQASKAGFSLPKSDPMRDTLHDIRNIALKAMMDLDKAIQT